VSVPCSSGIWCIPDSYAPARRAAKGDRAPGTPGQGQRPLEPNLGSQMDAGRLRGGRPGATAPPAPPARDCVPWNPDSMHACAECLTRMPMGRLEQAGDSPDRGIPEACAGATILRPAAHAGGLGGSKPTQRGARGAAPLGTPISMHACAERLARMARGRYVQQAVVQISAYRRHASVPASCGQHHMQGVWGAARPPSGERERRSARSHPGEPRSVSQRRARAAQ
jgi:hypothetical protein